MDRICGCHVRVALSDDWNLFASEARLGLDPRRLLSDLRSSRDRQRSLAILKSARGCPVRHRVLLQWLLPDLIREVNAARKKHSQIGRSFDCEEVGQRVLAAGVVAVATLAGRRLEWPLLALRSELRHQLHQTLDEDDSWYRQLEVFDEPESWPAPTKDVEFGLLCEVVAAGAIEAEDAEIIELTRLHGFSIQEVADLSGRSYRAVQQRRWRAERSLARHIEDHGWAS